MRSFPTKSHSSMPFLVLLLVALGGFASTLATTTLTDKQIDGLMDGGNIAKKLHFGHQYFQVYLNEIPTKTYISMHFDIDGLYNSQGGLEDVLDFGDIIVMGPEENDAMYVDGSSYTFYPIVGDRDYFVGYISGLVESLTIIGVRSPLGQYTFKTRGMSRFLGVAAGLKWEPLSSPPDLVGSKLVASYPSRPNDRSRLILLATEDGKTAKIIFLADYQISPLPNKPSSDWILNLDLLGLVFAKDQLVLFQRRFSKFDSLDTSEILSFSDSELAFKLESKSLGTLNVKIHEKGSEVEVTGRGTLNISGVPEEVKIIATGGPINLPVKRLASNLVDYLKVIDPPLIPLSTMN